LPRQRRSGMRLLAPQPKPAQAARFAAASRLARATPTGVGAAGVVHEFSRLPIFPGERDRGRPELTPTAPGDSFEREAERVATAVLRAPEPQLQRACSCGGDCPTCSLERHGHDGPRPQASRTRANAPEPSPPSPVYDVLRAPGQPLDAATRAFMEPRFGHDFGRVRIHIDGQAAESAETLQARAYTLGNRIVFGAGQYAPGTAAGRQLIAHELTHVLQQGSTPRPMRQAEPEAGDEDEAVPRREGMEVGGAASVQVLERGGLRLSRDLAVEPTRPDAPEPELTEEQ